MANKVVELNNSTGLYQRYPWDEIGVGDSFLVRPAPRSVEQRKKLIDNIEAAGKAIAKTKFGGRVRFVARGRREGVEVIRVNPESSN